MRFTTKAILMAALISAMSVASCGTKNAAAAEDAAPASAEAAEAVADTVAILADDALLRPGMKADILTVVDFNAPWCGPCKKLDEPMKKAAAMYGGRVKFYSANVDELTATDEAFGINKNVPVVALILPDGSVKKYETLSPFISSDELKNSDKDQAEKIIFDNLVVIIDENL
ncbi:MAG: thioredoxin family protein [Clostridium sp.]|nr:thioredoxin family protein [Clostridium sp.]